MIRFLVLCIIFLLLYLGFNAIGALDWPVNIQVCQYNIQTTAFTCIAVFFLTQLALMVIFRIISSVFNLPFLISQNWHRRRLKKINDRLLTITAEFFMGHREKSVELANKLMPEIEESNKDLATLILAESENNFNVKIQHLRTLLDKKNYSVYAAKTLASILSEHNHFIEAEEYATRAFNEDGTAPQLILTLIHIYAKLGNWSKVIFMISKLQRADSRLIASCAEEIARYYYLAAESALTGGNDEEALGFLESSLELRPYYLEALNLFTELNINRNKSALILKILKSAFTIHPSFEIALLYIKCSKSSPEAIYGTLAGLTNPAGQQGLFMAVAAYLGLGDRIRELKEAGSLSYETRS